MIQLTHILALSTRGFVERQVRTMLCGNDRQAWAGERRK